MIVDTTNGTPVYQRHFEATISEFENKVTIKATEYEAMSLPKIAELQAYRTIVVDYLNWQASDPMSSMRVAMDYANDTSLSQEARRNRIMQVFTKSDEEERIWKNRMDAAFDELSEWVTKDS